MSTVLTKPVLLDETGQAIVGKLQDIQQAIGGTGEFIPINIRVTTPPTKTNYLAGEALDLSGMVVTLVANNGGMYDVTGDCVFSPADGSVVTSSTTEVNISYTWYKDSTVFTAVQPIGIKELASIAVTTPPTQTEFFAGDELDLTGIVVTAQFDDGSTANVTNDCEFSPADGDVLALSDSTINISYTLGSITKTTTQSITIEVPVYGVEWDGTSTSAWTRTDKAADFVDPIPQMSDGAGGWTQGSSPFDNIAPWSGMERINDADGGVLVKIPKFYYKWVRDGIKMKLQIAPQQKEGFLVSPAHSNRGDGQGERDVVYIGAYHCAISTYKSTSGVMPRVTMKRSDFRTNIHNIGAEYYQQDFAMWWTLRMLYLVEFADWNCQKKIGIGGRSDSNVVNNGATDAMSYHTGTTATDVNTAGATRYRYIEDLWGNVAEWLDGIRCTNSPGPIYCIINPNEFSETSGGVEIGTATSANSNAYPVVVKTWTNPSTSGYEFALVADECLEGSGVATYDTYDCDMYALRKNSSSRYVVVTGGTTGVPQLGLFYLGTSTDSTDSDTGSRLMKLPSAS